MISSMPGIKAGIAKTLQGESPDLMILPVF